MDDPREPRGDVRTPAFPGEAGVYARALVRVVPSRSRPSLGGSANFTRKRRAAPSPRRRPPVLPQRAFSTTDPNLGLPPAGFPAGGGFADRSPDQLADPATRVSFTVNLSEVRLRETG